MRRLPAGSVRISSGGPAILMVPRTSPEWFIRIASNFSPAGKSLNDLDDMVLRKGWRCRQCKAAWGKIAAFRTPESAIQGGKALLIPTERRRLVGVREPGRTAGGEAIGMVGRAGRRGFCGGRGVRHRRHVACFERPEEPCCQQQRPRSSRDPMRRQRLQKL